MPEKGSTCKKCAARVRMQSKYLAQILDLYEDFNVTVMPQLDDEVRGVQGLLAFGRMLLDPPKPEQ
jgi:arsenite-transporting ATPase